MRGRAFIDLSVTQPAPFRDCHPFFPIGACDGTTHAANVADAELDGIEVDLAYRSPRLLLRLGYGGVDGEDEDTGAPLGTLAPDQLSVMAALQLPERDGLLGCRALAAARFDEVDSPAEVRDGYVVNDLFLAWQPDSGPLAGLRVDIGADNLFDRKYARVFTGATAPGRNLKALVRYTVQW